MDVGLALENKDADVNKDICLTNKFLAYVQAGLYIFATDTFGQNHFLNLLGPSFGIIIRTSLRSQIQNFEEDLVATEKKRQRWKKAKTLSWEQQSEILIKVMS